MDREITNFEEASKKMRWIKSVYSMWIEDRQFFLELDLTLDDECPYLSDVFQADEIKIENAIVKDYLFVHTIIDGDRKRKVTIPYNKIQELAKKITDVINDDLTARIN